MANQKEPTKVEIILELLKMLEPVINDTAETLSAEIMAELKKYYDNDIAPTSRVFKYVPKVSNLAPYELEITLLQSNNDTMIGYADETSIQVKYLNKNSNNFKSYGNHKFGYLEKNLYHIIKHECSHYYLKLKGMVDLLYHTHPDGLLKYYEDEQEMILHSREIFERLTNRSDKWKEYDNETLIRLIAREVKNLQSHTNIPYPLKAPLQKKYVKLIMNHYVIPNKKL